MTWAGLYYASISDGTVACATDMLSNAWLWEPPSPLPEIRDPLPRHIPDAPHIPRRYFQVFTGHKFGFRGKKCL